MNSVDLLFLAKKFAPMKTQHELIRLGPFFDGGYLVPNDLAGISACFSPGVAGSAYFESDLLRIFGIPSHLADLSVDGPPHGFPAASFMKKYIGGENNDEFMTMEKWVNEKAPANGDLLLQMDIEGAEYDSLLATPDEILKRFRVIVVEIHFLDRWIQDNYYEEALSLITKLEQNFVVVHNHPNNWGKTTTLDGVEYPCTIEVTFLRKDRCVVDGPSFQIPHRLDLPCGPQIPDFVLPEAFRG